MFYKKSRKEIIYILLGIFGEYEKYTTQQGIRDFSAVALDMDGMLLHLRTPRFHIAACR